MDRKSPNCGPDLWDDNGTGVLTAVATHLRELARHARRPGLHARWAADLLACAATLEAHQAPDPQAASRVQALELILFEALIALGRIQVELEGTLARERQARRWALQDSLTALPNRMGLRQRLDEALSHAGQHGLPLAVLYLDLDDFKPVNDTHGHDVGDTLLRIVATRLRGALRASDHVGRLGGDEFVCVIGQLPDRQALDSLVDKLVAALAAPIRIGMQTLWVSASLGIALWPDDGVTGDELLRHADQAMYDAKRRRPGVARHDRQLALGGSEVSAALQGPGAAMGLCLPAHRPDCEQGRD